MGTSIPHEPRWAPDTPPAEQSLWRWAVDQLDDRVLVLPQVAMSVPRGGRYDEAEADLILLDPDLGIVVVEVKGGTVSYDARNVVWRRDGKEIRDPVAQVKRTRSILREALDTGGVDTNRLALRWAVAVPECRLEAPGQPVLDHGQLWDSLAARQFDRLHRRTVGSLMRGEEPPGHELTDAVAALLRGRTREGSPALSTAVDRHEEQVRVHTESHRNVFHHFGAHRNVLVNGAAGTGKTVIAVQTAARFAAQGDRVLLACWNIVLADWLTDVLRAELERMGSPASADVTTDATGKVVVGHLGGLAAQPDGISRDGRGDKEYYYEYLPEQLTPAVTRGEFDVVVLDEAQDLSELWVLAVASLVRRGGRWYAFSDGFQDLFGNDPALPDFLEVQHELRENFRNSEQIAAFAAGFGPLETDCVTGPGPPVRFVPAPHDRVVARTDEVARRLIRDEKLDASDVAVLWLFHNPNRHRSDHVADAVRSGQLVRTNGASFKGMERPAVVLGLDMDPRKAHEPDDVRRSIYTAATRARSYLAVVGDPEVAAAYGFAQLAEDLRSQG